ncbi:hypothetical protein KRR26_32565 [Corallococcus sp. M34]|uniref:hypothetical protein n=1 Tax=Citreicoccus inhibens TaxID=2849499 RepID=UPI001C240010|nr:hypothetical protein [Citreicoccus inhibens]MBU8900352.1 hypothetical protein [Citreicoccus inhibens]
MNLKSPHGSNTSRVVEKVLRTGAEKVLADDAGSDVFDVLFHPERKVVQAVAFNTDGHVRWKVLDASLREDFEVLGRMADGDFSLGWYPRWRRPGATPRGAVGATANRRARAGLQRRRPPIRRHREIGSVQPREEEQRKTP